MLQQNQRTPGSDTIPTHTEPDEGTALLHNAPPRARLTHTIKTLPLKIFRSIRADMESSSYRSSPRHFHRAHSSYQA